MMFLGLLTAIPGLATALLGYLKTRADADVAKNGQNVAADQAINLAVVQGRIEELKIAAAQRAADRGSIWTEWMMPALFIPCFLYACSVIFDSMCLFGHVVGSWKIATLPGAYDGLVIGVLGSVAGLKLSNDLGNVVKKIFTK